MKKRTLSTIALWLIVFGTLYWTGAVGGVFLLTLMTFFAQRELYQLFKKTGLHPMEEIGLCFGSILIIGSYFIPHGETSIVAISVIICSLVYLNTSHSLNDLAGTLLGLLYIPFLLQFYCRMLSLSNGLLLVVWLIATAKFTDVGGYLIGSKWGRHKMAPTISPGKTWEGVLGGILLSALVAGLLARFFDLFHWLQACLLALPIAIAAIFSDLLESAIKRNATVKDSGKLLPGIGGALDLVDSLILSGPVGYFLLTLFL